MTTLPAQVKLKLNLSKVMDDIFMVLNEKEKEVVIKRFSLDNKERKTLESIGQKFNVTRERVRQIEKIALSKLKRTVGGTKLSYVHELAAAILKENGGMMTEAKILKEILETIEKTIDVDHHIIKLALTIAPNLNSIEKNGMIKLSWHFETITATMIREILDLTVKTLKSKKEIQSEENLVKTIQASSIAKGNTLEEKFILSCLEADLRMKKMPKGYGLMTWRHINPKSIRDKALIILRKNEKPMHFIEIADAIIESKFDHKKVTVQAVHNELIRYPYFVLVGRGLYALKEWGYQEGTVSDVIENLLRKKSPMTKQDIIKGVLKQRQVKKGTISLNLQKNAQFVRVGRAVYALDESLKVQK
jgi:DNA-directed RNA polymerase delta subunit